MEDFFGKALGVVSGNDGIMPIAIMFVFASIVTLIVNKTIKLNQKQSYVMLSMVFVGMMAFLIGLYAMFLKLEVKSDSKDKNTISNVANDNNESEINISSKTPKDLKDSVNGNSGSKINMSF